MSCWLSISECSREEFLKVFCTRLRSMTLNDSIRNDFTDPNILLAWSGTVTTVEMTVSS
jgi:hypothetical protein